LETHSVGIFAILLAFGGILTTIPTATAQAPAAGTAAFNKLADEFFDQAYFKYAPTQGTLAGFHQYDHQLENFTKAGVDAQVAPLRSFEKKFSAVDAADRSDHAGRPGADQANIQTTLLTLGNDSPLGEKPDTYS
jgi:hypothetical protein